MRVGTPISSQLIQAAWNNFNPGKPTKKTGPNRPVARDVPMFWNNLIPMDMVGVEPTEDVNGLSFKEIRRFADEHEITRIVIETCKDQLCKLRWTFRIKPKEGENSQVAKERSEKDTRVKFLNQFFKSPDKEHDFYQWLRMLMEEVLVLSVVPIWKREDLLDRPYGFYLLDTATIKRCVDDMGLTPDPNLPYPFNVGYQQIIKGEINAEFTKNNLIWYNVNPRTWAFYPYSPIEQIILTLSTGMRRMAMQLAHYTDGNVPAMFMKVPKEWSVDQVKQFQNYWNELMSGNLGEMAKGWAIPGEADPVFPQKETLKDDFDEWIARVICYAYSVSPNAFIKNLNRATSEQAREQADEEGLQSRIMLVTRLMDLIVEKWFGYDDIEFHLILDRPQDSKKQAEIDNIYIRSGVKSVDEVRRELSLGPIGAPNRVYTNNGYIPLMEGDKPAFDVFQQKLIREEGSDKGNSDNQI